MILGEIQKALGKKQPPFFKAVSTSGGAARKPTRVERMLLIAAAAQVLAGPGKNPTKAQLAKAKAGVDQKIKREVMAGAFVGSSFVGGFWDKVKTLAKTAGSAAVRAAPAAVGFVSKNPQIVLPVVAGAIASPFLISAISAASKSSQAVEEKSEKKPKDLPPGETVAFSPEAAKEGVKEEDNGIMGGQFKSWDERGAFVGSITEEEAALAESGGSSERAAMARVRGTCVMGGAFVGAASVPHDKYRATVMKRASALAGGKAPDTRHFFLAKKDVDKALKQRGVKIALPGAAPSRRTV